MSEHTPGPWKWINEDADMMQLLIGPSNEMVMNFGTDGSWGSTNGEPPEAADASLIVAAPDLLAALERLRNKSASCSESHYAGTEKIDPWDQADEAIAKATKK